VKNSPGEKLSCDWAMSQRRADGMAAKHRISAGAFNAGLGQKERQKF
jgi:hypothetical protein